MYSPQFQAGETKIVGQAMTVKFVPKADVSSPKVQGNYVCSHHILVESLTSTKRLLRSTKSPKAQ